MHIFYMLVEWWTELFLNKTNQNIQDIHWNNTKECNLKVKIWKATWNFTMPYSSNNQLAKTYLTIVQVITNSWYYNSKVPFLFSNVLLPFELLFPTKSLQIHRENTLYLEQKNSPFSSLSQQLGCRVQTGFQNFTLNILFNSPVLQRRKMLIFLSLWVSTWYQNVCYISA